MTPEEQSAEAADALMGMTFEALARPARESAEEENDHEQPN